MFPIWSNKFTDCGDSAEKQTEIEDDLCETIICVHRLAIKKTADSESEEMSKSSSGDRNDLTDLITDYISKLTDQDLISKIGESVKEVIVVDVENFEGSVRTIIAVEDYLKEKVECSECGDHPCGHHCTMFGFLV